MHPSRPGVFMSKLEVVFRLGLAHPFLLMDRLNAKSATTTFPETGNTVWIEAPRGGPRPEPATDRGVFDVLILHVERECKAEERDAVCHAKLHEWGMIHDAATTLWRVLEYVRDEDFLRNSTVAGYPVVPSDTPQSNPIVQTASAELTFDGEALSPMALGGIPSIQIAYGVWDRVCERLERREEVPPYRSFLLDAFYFATSGDPIRAVIMACAAWETALRHYLSSISAFARQAKGKTKLSALRALAERAKGRTLLDGFDGATREHLTGQITGLTMLRNNLLHKGQKDLAKEDVVGMTLAVDAAIEWLFR